MVSGRGYVRIFGSDKDMCNARNRGAGFNVRGGKVGYVTRLRDHGGSELPSGCLSRKSTERCTNISGVVTAEQWTR